MSFVHYELAEKWKRSAALVFGRRCEMQRSTIEDHYHDCFASFADHTLDYQPSVWPLRDPSSTKDEWVPCVVGTGDFYFRLDDGVNWYGKWAPAKLREMRHQQATLGDTYLDLSDHTSLRGPSIEAHRWHLVSSSGTPVSLFYGLTIKPGKVGNPEGLEVVRARLGFAKAHPRSVVGCWLADTAEATTFDPSDARIDHAKALLSKAYPKAKAHGFVVIPTPPAFMKGGNAPERRAPPPPQTPPPQTQGAPRAHTIGDALPDTMDGWRARVDAFFGGRSIVEDTILFSPNVNGVIHVLGMEAPDDALEAWYETQRFFDFNDQRADVRRWECPHASLLDLDIVLHDDEGLAHRLLAHLRCSDGGYLFVLHRRETQRMKSFLGIPDEVSPTDAEIVLGHG